MSDSALSPLEPDECLSSWSDRNNVRVEPHNVFDERDYGEFALALPSASRKLRASLRRAAMAPDQWMLRPWDRTLYCPQCMAGDWVRGHPPYWRRAWTEAWRTCCPRHGMLLDTLRRPEHRLSFAETLRRRGWYGRHLGVWSFGHRQEQHLDLSIGRDRRAIHLERALAIGGQRVGWFPSGFDQTSLREAYAAIVRALLKQFYFIGPENNEDTQRANDAWLACKLGVFLWCPNSSRYAINVLAEAVIARWSETPLPEVVAPDFRTRLLLQAIGWNVDRPLAAPADYVRMRPRPRIPAPHPGQVAGCARWFARVTGEALAARQERSFTRRQAEAIGLDTGVFDDLHRLTTKGRVGWFEPRRGILRPRAGAIPLHSEESFDLSGLDLPDWAKSLPPPPVDPAAMGLFSDILQKRPDDFDDESDVLPW